MENSRIIKKKFQSMQTGLKFGAVSEWKEGFNGRAIFVRFVISNITPDSCRFEQAFSGDGGKTWEVNWIATDTRVEDGTDQDH